jgi:hypothetical protein
MQYDGGLHGCKVVSRCALGKTSASATWDSFSSPVRRTLWTCQTVRLNVWTELNRPNRPDDDDDD